MMGGGTQRPLAPRNRARGRYYKSKYITMRTCIVIVFIITSFLLKCNLAYLQSYIFFPNTQSVSLRNHTTTTYGIEQNN